MSEAYKGVIEIIAGGEFDANKIAILLAKENPELFIKLNNEPLATSLPKQSQYLFAKTSYLNNGRKPIQTIKDLRHEFNLSLMDAKHIVDKLRDDLGEIRNV